MRPYSICRSSRSSFELGFDDIQSSTYLTAYVVSMCSSMYLPSVGVFAERNDHQRIESRFTRSNVRPNRAKAVEFGIMQNESIEYIS